MSTDTGIDLTCGPDESSPVDGQVCEMDNYWVFIRGRTEKSSLRIRVASCRIGHFELWTQCATDRITVFKHKGLGDDCLPNLCRQVMDCKGCPVELTKDDAELFLPPGTYSFHKSRDTGHDLHLTQTPIEMDDLDVIKATRTVCCC